MRVAFKIAYDGTRFHGFQRQPNLRTVEGEIIKALNNSGIMYSDFKSASRTDRGVSALGNVVAITTEDEKALNPMVLNARLEDVWILSAIEVPQDFHPRFWAKSKVYRYYLPSIGLEVEKVKECSQLFLGVHDFSAFSRVDGRDTVRSIDRIEVFTLGPILIIEIEAKSFLWEMVRRIVKALELCGLGRLSCEEIKEMLEGKFEKSKKVPPAPPEGLLLVDIKYEGIEFPLNDKALKKFKREVEERFRQKIMGAYLLWDMIQLL
ncbi:tRNA pseudouridine(38-40) synthase TruA [Pyrococcus abyssi]|uniref:tRNA pseudouridine synthase A n=1 Tax=Pyrococcus abyssi (strain GE5 / Orsay) TaxID=272844 RepID=TRUA_PYRAB|nr:tRNA pseudouridine(38-40) synthase TruA [Pyrococcus abyssi]Q9UZZ3.1 RecName: Full=tRNA pseudouridine synthase A; AltName: Full=tRNA pseudouridine(38-40) synthase; AltName: Full=tRNA pseudouridylate synthase I; AltName: Full=tRNA-uridine isomerase I [Pyrococcus abyssi GE5]CAB49913.1 truA pseudouridylate synthase I [Pyrococcus abyssi GE5]CCE70411.1 TPA: tRNA pseudouridine synthase A [Pyrococcus abyssi GE5]